MTQQNKKLKEEREAIAKQIYFLKQTEADLVDRACHEIQDALQRDDYERIAQTMAKIAESMQYYLQFRQAAFSDTPPADDRFVEIYTVFNGCYLVNPDYIVSLRMAEGDRGSAIKVGDTEYYTFTGYTEMKNKISESRESIRKAWGKARKEIEKEM